MGLHEGGERRMLHLTSANCTHLPAEGYAGVEKGTPHGGEEESREAGVAMGEIRCVRDTRGGNAGVRAFVG